MPQADAAQPVPAQEPVAQPEPVAAANDAEEEAMTYGYPNTLLLANDIQPDVLEFLPEDTRVEVLSAIQDQLESWHRERARAQEAAN